MSTPDDQQVEEILGSRYQRSLVTDIDQLEVKLEQVIQPQLITDLTANMNLYSHPQDGNQFLIEDERASTWYDLNELESAYLRPEAMRQTVKKIDDMFARLARFGVLSREHTTSEAAQ